jgi:SAM-dependent methyltransferase
MRYPFPDASFSFISVIATLHHLPLSPALERFRTLLAPGGVLAVLGLYRLCGLRDALSAAAALPASRVIRCFRRYRETDAPMLAPGQTLADIRDAARDCLPGSVLRRHLLFRYSLVWHKPLGPGCNR